MPIKPKPKSWDSMTGDELFNAGVALAKRFCALNEVPVSAFNNVPRDEWQVQSCAYYRPDTERMRKWTKTGVNVCVPLCKTPCGEDASRNWSWPGSVIDQTPYGVVAHEIGHHCDWLTGEKKWSYGSEYCEQCKEAAGEPPITSYGEKDPSEWFAESFRLFITNPELLRAIRPQTYEVFTRKWIPVTEDLDWKKRLGPNVPARVVRSLINKMPK